jgi:hypothetical protein
MEMLYFEASSGGIKWLIIVKYNYYDQPYEMSAGNAKKVNNFY